MAGGYSFKEFSDGQRRNYDAAVQIYAAFLEALRETRAFKGGRHWKRIKGRDYLYQYFDRLGHGRSLGPRSLHTEELLAQFTRARQKAARGLRDVRLKLAEQSRFCRAALLQRVPRLTAKILGLLERHDLLRESLMVIGVSAVHAYEFAAGAFLQSPRNLDLFAGGLASLTLAGEVPVADLLSLLRKADRSFEAVPAREFRVVNRRGFLVRVLRPGMQTEEGLGGPGAALAAAPGHLSHLLSSPKFSQVVIGRDGSPVRMVVPDPRAFALNRLWLSELPGREEVRKARDRGLAGAVAELVLRYLPQYHFFHADLRRFPDEVVRHAADLAEGFDLAADLDVEY
jgi:hypothetical protein